MEWMDYPVIPSGSRSGVSMEWIMGFMWLKFNHKVIGMSIVIFDLDGTLALIEHRRHFVEQEKPDWDAFFSRCNEDKPNEPVIEVYHALQSMGHTMWIFSGRSDQTQRDTVSWLYDKDIEFAKLVMRKEGDHQPDTKLKKSWLDKYFPIDKKNLLCTFDDRQSVVDMWRENGVTCFQVAPGNF